MNEQKIYQIKTSAESLHWINNSLGKIVKLMEAHNQILQTQLGSYSPNRSQSASYAPQSNDPF